jgi:hypothetical protein
MKHGYSANTQGALIFNTAILMVGSLYWGVSRGGGPSFDPGREIRQSDFDGLVTPITENDRIVGYKSQITGTYLEASNTNLTRLELGQAVTGAAPVQTIQPLPVGQVFKKANGQYLQDVRMIAERGDGKLYSVHFPYAVVLSYTAKANDKGEGEFSVTIEARLDASGTPPDLSVCPYNLEIRDVVP